MENQHGNMHNHQHCGCVHCLHYCSVCNIVYCCKCGQQWYQGWGYTYGIFGGSVTGSTTGTITSCSHIH